LQRCLPSLPFRILADLIVVGSHGYGRLRQMVLDSVAGAVVANAPCSVQVVRQSGEIDNTETAA
jgi:nucleotide-binding universal stress UspA family protein